MEQSVEKKKRRFQFRQQWLGIALLPMEEEAGIDQEIHIIQLLNACWCHNTIFRRYILTISSLILHIGA